MKTCKWVVVLASFSILISGCGRNAKEASKVCSWRVYFADTGKTDREVIFGDSEELTFTIGYENKSNKRVWLGQNSLEPNSTGTFDITVITPRHETLEDKYVFADINNNERSLSFYYESANLLEFTCTDCEDYRVELDDGESYEFTLKFHNRGKLARNVSLDSTKNLETIIHFQNQKFTVEPGGVQFVKVTATPRFLTKLAEEVTITTSIENCHDDKQFTEFKRLMVKKTDFKVFFAKNSSTFMSVVTDDLVSEPISVTAQNNYTQPVVFVIRNKEYALKEKASMTIDIGRYRFDNDGNIDIDYSFYDVSNVREYDKEIFEGKLMLQVVNNLKKLPFKMETKKRQELGNFDNLIIKVTDYGILTTAKDRYRDSETNKKTIHLHDSEFRKLWTLEITTSLNQLCYLGEVESRIKIFGDSILLIDDNKDGKGIAVKKISLKNGKLIWERRFADSEPLDVIFHNKNNLWFQVFDMKTICLRFNTNDGIEVSRWIDLPSGKDVNRPAGAVVVNLVDNTVDGDTEKDLRIKYIVDGKIGWEKTFTPRIEDRFDEESSIMRGKSAFVLIANGQHCEGFCNYDEIHRIDPETGITNWEKPLFCLHFDCWNGKMITADNHLNALVLLDETSGKLEAVGRLVEKGYFIDEKTISFDVTFIQINGDTIYMMESLNGDYLDQETADKVKSKYIFKTIRISRMDNGS